MKKPLIRNCQISNWYFKVNLNVAEKGTLTFSTLSFKLCITSQFNSMITSFNNIKNKNKDFNGIKEMKIKEQLLQTIK